MKTSLKIAGADLLRAGIALFLSFLVRNGKFPAQDDLGHGAGQAAVLIATQIFCMVLMGLHEERKLTRQEVALRISCAQAAAFILLISFSFMFSFRFFGPAFQGVFLFCAGFLQFLNRVDLRLTAYPFAKKI